MKKKKGWMAACGLTAAAFFIVWARLSVGEIDTMNRTAEGTKAAVVIDAGHGGYDPGKVGVSGTLEKEINLAVALKVERFLRESGYVVHMTRTEDKALCQGNEKRKKMTDMNNRVSFINEISPAVAVSIHQNSYSAGTRGAQVFYYRGAEKSKKLAGILQNTIREAVGDDNHRKEKANDSYYMLRKTSCPFVIVECGFLSNPREEALLRDEKYQEKMARGICEGIENFLYK